MKKIIALAAITLTALTFAAPAQADNDSNFGGGVNAANNWNFTAAAVCLQEVAVVPVLGDWVGDHVNNCSNGNVIDHTVQAVEGALPH
ncbi:hypothetical protein [Streptacidiphilus neutrinimicus]|uniref:hypothetical protein n=1 Tax=Streptacidiphilus neutrinimicus TaxID=105420 RepID=UPI0005A70EFD|nr:hypothetical protein [Streptacidiphilus neutrinimicus]